MGPMVSIAITQNGIVMCKSPQKYVYYTCVQMQMDMVYVNKTLFISIRMSGFDHSLPTSGLESEKEWN